jgi:uncharacterized protein (DUF2147 family)
LLFDRFANTRPIQGSVAMTVSHLELTMATTLRLLARSPMRFAALSRPLVALGVAAMTLHAFAQAAPEADPRGRWLTANGNLEVEIAPCGAALCGIVTKVLGNRSMSGDGAPMAPVDPRPALGMTLLQGFVPSGSRDASSPPAQWVGEIYNRENGKTYRCQMSLGTAAGGARELVLHAYVGIPLFGQTQRWHRVAPAGG